jgi:hypothetical protein
MIDYNNINEHEFTMMVNSGGYVKFTKAFFDSQLGLNTAFTEEEFHQAIEFLKAKAKKIVEGLFIADEEKEKKKQYIDASYSYIEDFLKEQYFVRIRS